MSIYNKLLADLAEQNNRELTTLQAKYEQMIKDLDSQHALKLND